MTQQYLVSFNDGTEDGFGEDKIFNNVADAKAYVKRNCDVYYNIAQGEWEKDEDGIFNGSGKLILSNCNDKSCTWFYCRTADIVNVEDL